MLQGKPKGVFGYGDDGALHEYVTADSRMAADTIHLADGDPAVNKVLSSDSVDGYFELSGVFLAPAVAGLGTTGAVAAAAGAAAAAAAAAGSSSQNNNASTPPAPIAATGALADASDTGTKGDNRTTITTPTITGKAPAGALVEVTLNGKTYTTTADANGNYSVAAANTQPLEVGFGLRFKCGCQS
jgi:hypothetical protein